MKVPKHIREKMHKLAELQQKSTRLSNTINEWFESRGFEMEDLRCGNGMSLEELDYGNDVTDIFCKHIENGGFRRGEG